MHSVSTSIEKPKKGKVPVIQARGVRSYNPITGGWDVTIHVPILRLKKAVGDAKAEAIMKAKPNGTNIG